MTRCRSAVQCPLKKDWSTSRSQHNRIVFSSKAATKIMETQQVAKNSNPSYESGVPHVQSTSGNAHDGTSSDFECGGGRPLVALADARCLMRHVSTTESSLLHCSETTLPCQRWIIEQNVVAQKSTSWHTVVTWMFPFCA